MLGPDTPQFTGNMAWRTVVPADRLGRLVPNSNACAWFGPNRHAVTYRLGAQGQLVNFVGVVEQDRWQEEGWSLQGERSEALKDFDVFLFNVREFVTCVAHLSLALILVYKPPIPETT